MVRGAGFEPANKPYRIRIPEHFQLKIRLKIYLK